MPKMYSTLGHYVHSLWLTFYIKTQLVSTRMQVWSLAYLSGLRICHCHKLWHRSQMMQLGSGVAVVWADSCSSHSTPILWTSCATSAARKRKEKKKKKRNTCLVQIGINCNDPCHSPSPLPRGYFLSIYSVPSLLSTEVPLHRWGNWGTEKLNNLPKVTQVVSDKADRMEPVCVLKAGRRQGSEKLWCYRWISKSVCFSNWGEGMVVQRIMSKFSIDDSNY